MVLILKKGASKKQLKTLERKLIVRKKTDLKKYCGKIRIQDDAMEIQKKLRDEWN
jgi:cytidylate kinase